MSLVANEAEAIASLDSKGYSVLKAGWPDLLVRDIWTESYRLIELAGLRDSLV